MDRFFPPLEGPFPNDDEDSTLKESLATNDSLPSNFDLSVDSSFYHSVSDLGDDSIFFENSFCGEALSEGKQFLTASIHNSGIHNSGSCNFG